MNRGPLHDPVVAELPIVVQLGVMVEDQALLFHGHAFRGVDQRLQGPDRVRRSNIKRDRFFLSIVIKICMPSLPTEQLGLRSRLDCGQTRTSLTLNEKLR